MEKEEFIVYIQGQEPIKAKKVLLATGGHPSGRKIALRLGHTIVNPVPSLFSLTIESSLLHQCSGLALDDVDLTLRVGSKSFQESGRVLITHWGISGPAVLKLSAFAARHLYEKKYNAHLSINWINSNYDETYKLFRKFRLHSSRKSLGTERPFKNLPKRLWLTFLKQVNIHPSIRWSELSLALEKKLINNLLFNFYLVCGRGPFGEEFVTAGGVDLREVNFSTMESLVIPGLYFAGELLNVDGVTGGFNFQHCWSSGWMAGRAIAKI